MIRREDAHHCVRIDGLQNVRRESNGGSGVSLRGFGQNLRRWNFWQLLDDFGAQMIVGENPDAFGRKNGAQAVDGFLN